MSEATMIVDREIAWDEAPDRVVFKYRPEWPAYVPEHVCEKVPGKMRYGERRPKCSNCGYGLGDDRWRYCPQCGAKVVG